MPDKLVLGCGYLGSRVARLWSEQGHRVFASTRRPESAAELAQDGLEPVVCDVTDPASLRDLPPADTVVHCVGLDRSAGHSMRAVYVDGLAHVVATVRAWQHLSPTFRFLHVSSTSVYGQTLGEEVDESSPTEPLDESGRIVL